MGKIQCPYCFSYKTLAIVCTDNIQPKESKYYKDKCNVKRIEKGEAILSNTNLHYSKEYDGKIIKRRTYDRFCSECKKPFYYISVKRKQLHWFDGLESQKHGSNRY